MLVTKRKTDYIRLPIVDLPSSERTGVMHVVEDAIKVERLALIALQLIDPTQRTDAWLEKSFQEALPKALRLVELTEEDLR
jgi:hypothetical protein